MARGRATSYLENRLVARITSASRIGPQRIGRRMSSFAPWSEHGGAPGKNRTCCLLLRRQALHSSDRPLLCYAVGRTSVQVVARGGVVRVAAAEVAARCAAAARVTRPDRVRVLARGQSGGVPAESCSR